MKMILICGKSASGKDTLLNELTKDSKYSKIISHTSRPIRQHEVDGEDYNFVDVNYFLENMNDFLEITEFNGWMYGAQYSTLSKDKINIGVFNPEGVKIILDWEEFDIDVKVIYVDVNDKVRMLRSLNREDNPDVAEIIRRYSTDEKDFIDIDEYYDFVVDGEVDADKLALIIEKELSSWIK